MLRVIILSFLWPIYIFAQSYPLAPSNYVTDDANVLKDNEEVSLNKILREFEDSTSIQLFVYTSNSLNGAVMADLCQEIFHNWKIGNKKTNNGVLIGIFVNDHKFRIHTGYGMEGVLPDLRTKKIQDEYMRPQFKLGDYYGGIYDGIQRIKYYSNHEYRPGEDEEGPPLWIIIPYSIQVFLFFIECIILFKFFKGSRKSQWSLFLYGLLVMLFPFIGVIGMIILVISAYREGRFKNGGTRDSTSTETYSSSYSSSDSSSSSDSGSSFDGGGGGDSGGGGSDSSW